MSIWDRAKQLATNAYNRSREIAAAADRRRKKAAADRAKKAAANRAARAKANKRAIAKARQIADRARARAASYAEQRKRASQFRAAQRRQANQVIIQKTKEINKTLMKSSLISVTGAGTAALSAKEVDKSVASAEASFASIFPDAATPRTALQIATERNASVAKAKLDLIKKQPDSKTKEIDLTNAAAAYLKILKAGVILASPSPIRGNLMGRALFDYLKTLRKSQQPIQTGTSVIPYPPAPLPEGIGPTSKEGTKYLLDQWRTGATPTPATPQKGLGDIHIDIDPRILAKVNTPCFQPGRVKTCANNPSIILSECKTDYSQVPTGDLRFVPTGNKCSAGMAPSPPPTPLSQCLPGETKEVTCGDGSKVVIAKCDRDIPSGMNIWMPTGNACQAPLIAACKVGEKKITKGPDGKDIVTHTCVLDPATRNTYWAPTPPQQGKSIRILTEGNLKAFVGMNVTITAGVMCGGIPSNGETAILLIDGKKISESTTSGGFVSFNWVATIDKSRSQKVEVFVPESTTCGQFGAARDTRIITVSRKVPEIEARLAAERAQYDAQVAALLAERARITQSSLPSPPAVRPVYVPPPITVPDQPPIPDQPPVEKVPGTISVPDIPKPPKSLALVDVSIDGKFLGQPPISLSVTPGKHQIRVDLQNFTSIQRSVNVAEGETVTITDMRFI